MTIDMQSQASY